MSPTTKRKAFFVFCFLLFLVSRLYLAFVYKPDGDIYLFRKFGFELKEAENKKINVYDLRKERSEVPSTSHDFVKHNLPIIEYPPLALLWISIPAFLTKGDFNFQNIDATLSWNWVINFRAFYFIFDLILFLVLLFSCVRPKVGEGQPFGLFLFVCSGIILFSYYYERLDLWLGGLLLFATLALVRNSQWYWSYLLLALAINFKLVPLILSPLFLVGALPVNSIRGSSKKLFNSNLVKLLVIRLAVLLSFVSLIFLPFFLRWGRPTLSFLSFHKDRGIQIESTYANLLILLSYFGFPVYTDFDFGAFNLQGGMSPIFAKVAPIASILFVTYLFGLFVRAVLRNAQEENLSLSRPPNATVAQTFPNEFVVFQFLTLLVSIVTSKVFSPQYLFWLVPLLPILSFKKVNLATTLTVFLLACLTTMVFLEWFYIEGIMQTYQLLPSGKISFGVPNDFTMFLIFIRNVLLIVVAGFLYTEAKHFLRARS